MPTTRGEVVTGVVRNKIYIFDGEGNSANGFNGGFLKVEVYDSRRDRWEELAPMPMPRHETGAVAVAIGDRIYLLDGGEVIGAAPPVAVNNCL